MRLLVPVVVIAGVLALVLWQRNRLVDLGSTLGRADGAWIAVAILAQALSIAALARQQRGLLSVEGDRVPLRPVLATTYAGGAISLSLPLVGKAASVAYTYRRFTATGLRPAVIGWAVVMSSVFTTTAYLVVSAFGAIVTGDEGGVVTGVLSLAGVLALVSAFVGVLRVETARARAEQSIAVVVSWIRKRARRPARPVDAAVRAAVETVAALRLSRAGALTAAWWSVTNVLATIACLAASIVAVGGDVPWGIIILAWAASSGISLLGLTPGGIGIVEVALSATLIAAGMDDATAIAAALIYRGISFWLSLAAGGVILAAIRTRARADRK